MRNLTIVAVALMAAMAMTACSGEHESGNVDAAGESDHGEAMMASAAHKTIPIETITGGSTTLADFNGKVVLLVNVASECGFTKQYSGLQELHSKYSDSGLVVIGFPANNFGGQEPGSNEEILEFCQSKFDVAFPMMAKVSVKGEDKHPLFTYLTENSDMPGEIEWNFAKFLLDREGSLVSRFGSRTEPMSDEMLTDIRKLL